MLRNAVRNDRNAQIRVQVVFESLRVSLQLWVREEIEVSPLASGAASKSPKALRQVALGPPELLGAGMGAGLAL